MIIFLKKFFVFFVKCNLIVHHYIAESKYVEGHIKTLEDWVFVARFCFLSGKGRYEYQIEFERRYGEPQLLLYYDDKSQWPAVYKTGKTCTQKVSVLNPGDNQIVKLSARSPHNILSGCAIRTNEDKKQFTSTRFQPSFATTKSIPYDLNYTDYDKFLITSTYTPDLEIFNISNNFGNETEKFYVKHHLYVDGDNAFGNQIENYTYYKEYAEELYETVQNGNISQRNARIKRSYNQNLHSTLTVSCKSAGGFLTARERWWYIAIANCGSKNGVDIHYKFRMTNGPPGDFWHEHFSADEIYIPPILLIDSLIYTIMLLAIFICAIELKSRHLFHCTYRLFALSVLLQYLGLLFSGVAWAKYGVTGLGPHTTLGMLLQGASEMVFLAMLLLLSKGYTITRAKLSTCATVKLTIFFNIYVVVYVTLFIYREEVFDPGDVLNIYESPAGLGIAGLRCGAWGAFLISINSTVRKFPEKSTFYFPFGIMSSAWILGGPVLTFIGIAFFDPWVRESVICGVSSVLSIGGHLSFLWLTWPSRANKSFPYHVRTNHVGVSTTEDNGTNYPRHVYEASAPATTISEHHNVIIPSSARTDHILNDVYNKYLHEKDNYNYNVPCYFSVASDRNSQLNKNNQENSQINEIRNQSEQSKIRNSLQHNQLQMETELEEPNNCPEMNSSLIQSSNNDIAEEDSKPLKANPFLINGAKNAPNKIILKPLNCKTHRSENEESVIPIHLFAAHHYDR